MLRAIRLLSDSPLSFYFVVNNAKIPIEQTITTASGGKIIAAPNPIAPPNM